MPSFRTRNGRVQARITLTGFPTVTKTFPDLRSAREWAKVTEADLLRGAWKPAAKPAGKSAGHGQSPFTLSDALLRYKASVTPTKRGAQVEGYRIDALLRSRSLASLPIVEVTAAHIAAYRDERLGLGLSGSSVTRELALLSHVFKVSGREWGISEMSGCSTWRNPCASVDRPRQNAPRDRVLAPHEESLLFAELDKCRNWIVPVLVRFALETGARRGEILSLRWKDIDLTQCTARLDGKTGARVIPLSALAVTLLQNLPRSLSGKVFSIPVRSLRQAFERAVARARLGDFVFHDLRHCALTRIARHHQHHAFQQSRRTATDTRLGGTDSD